MLGLLAALFLILTITATAVVVLGSNTPSSKGGDTPRAALESWGAAVVAGDFTRADTYLTASMLGRQTSRQIVAGSPVKSVTIDAVTTYGDQATASVSIVLDYTGGITITYHTTLSLVRESDGWKIDHVSNY
jgi:hypothetical protein